MSHSARSRVGFTLFELLAVLTVVSISLVVLVGAFGSWGSAHALTGATQVLEAGLQQARTLAVGRNQFVVVEYGSTATNGFKTLTTCQISRCTNDAAEVAAELVRWSAERTALDLQHLVADAPALRFSGHVRLGNLPDTADAGRTLAEVGTLVFRPDGSVWSWDDQRSHIIAVFTQERFSRQSDGPEPLVRYVRVDLATGLVTVIKPEVTP